LLLFPFFARLSIGFLIFVFHTLDENQI
jgi:hypothetical protein